MQSRAKILEDTLLKLLRRKSTSGVQRIIEGAHAADLAVVFRRLTNSQRNTLFGLIQPLEKQADTLCEVDPDVVHELLDLINDEHLLELLQEMSGDDGADMLEHLPEERREKILRQLNQAGAEEVTDLYTYDSETAAGIMTPEVFALVDSTTVEEAIKTLQAHSDEFEISYYLYVTNRSGDLVGVVSLRELVLSSPLRPIEELMETDVVRVGMTTDQEEVARVVAQYNLLAVPVVDATNKLVGAVTVDDIIDVIRLEATEDMLKMAGVGDEFDGQASAIGAAKARLPWLLASFLGGITAAILIGAFEASIAKVVPLAAFIPIVLGMGGNVGIQSATIVTRGIALGRVETGEVFSVLSRELVVAVICGMSYGMLLGLVAWGRYTGTDMVDSSLLLGVTVGLAVAAAMVMAATIGAAIPILFARLNVDPALASGPFVTTTVDVLGIAVYFGIAVALLGI